MLLSFAVIRGRFVTVHHDPKTDRVGIILRVADDQAKVVLNRGPGPTRDDYVPASKTLLQTIPPENWRPDRPMILTVLQNADAVTIDTCTVLFDSEDRPMIYVGN